MVLSARKALAEELVVMKIVLNREDMGEFFLVLTTDNDIWVKKDDIDSIGLKDGLGSERSFDQETYISLKSIPELNFHLNEEDVTVDITAPPGMFREHDINISYTKPYKVVYTKDQSAFLNYAANYNHKEEDPITDISAELGISSGDYFGMSTFSYQKIKEEEKTVRLMTNLTHNNRKELRTTTLGDFSASSGFLSSGEVLGGINISKNYSMDPVFLKFPSLDINGTVDTPSDIEIYMNGLLVQKEKLSPGIFSFNNVPATVGLGTSTMVITDVFGREHTITSPYYYSDRLLKKGLHEYSYSLGYIRNNYGIESFSYGNPAFLGFHNFGLSNSVKAGCAAEASGNTLSMGPSASILIPGSGILDAVAAFSHSEGKYGFTGYAGNSFQSRSISTGVSIQYNSREYSNLSTKPSDDKPRFQVRGSIGMGNKNTGFLTAEYSYADMYENTEKSRAAVSYNRILSKNTTFFIIAGETRELETTFDVFAGLHIYFGKDTSGSVSYSGGSGNETKKISIQKSIPSGNGFGYGADLRNSGDSTYVNGDVLYKNNTGIYGLDYSNKSIDTGYKISVSGGIGLIDNSIFFSRPIYDSFAKVKVDNLEGVRVYKSGNEIGRTDKDGKVIVPNIRSFHDNRIGIESSDIPINYNIESLKQYISAPYRSGSLVEFNVSKIQGFGGFVNIIENGAEVPAEFGNISVNARDKTIHGFIGRDGEFYIENIPLGKHPATVIYKGKECIFDIIIPDTDEIMVDLGEITCGKK